MQRIRSVVVNIGVSEDCSMWGGMASGKRQPETAREWRKGWKGQVEAGLDRDWKVSFVQASVAGSASFSSFSLASDKAGVCGLTQDAGVFVWPDNHFSIAVPQVG